MAMHPDDITRMIRDAFPDAEIKLVDTAGDRDHYDVTIISSAFAGKSRVEQHRMVYTALQGNMGSALHALAVKTATPS